MQKTKSYKIIDSLTGKELTHREINKFNDNSINEKIMLQELPNGDYLAFTTFIE